MKKDNQKAIESKIVGLLNSLKIPFSGTVVQDFLSENIGQRKYHISPFQQISVSAVGPVFYINKKDSKIYTLLQRRVRDDYQWWFPGGYAELPPCRIETLLKDNQKGQIKIPSFEKIKQATVDEYYRNIAKYGSWQKARKEINNPEFVRKLFKKYKLNWPKELDFNWQDAWAREVKEEMDVDVKKYKNAVILDFKNHTTFMIGTERDRLINSDGRFCAMLGILDKEPKTTPESEIVEARWVALSDIKFDKKRKKHFCFGYDLTVYAASFFEEALFEILCHEIKKNSLIKNKLTSQKISRFSSPQNIQSYIFEKAKNYDFSKLSHLKKFLSWEFGDLDIGNNLCSKEGNDLYNLCLLSSIFLARNNIDNFTNLVSMNSFLKKKISKLDFTFKN